MRIIIDLDESGGVVVERQGGSSLQGGAIQVGDRVAAPAIRVIDAGPPPAWLLRALGVAPVAVRVAPDIWEGEDAGAARA